MTVKAPKVQTVEAKREEVREKWSLHKSVFSARKKEAASKDFYDTYASITVVCAHAKTPRAAVLLCRECVNRKAFEIDWGRVVAKERFCRVVLKAANDDSDELEQVMLVVKKYYGLLSDAFEYYGASPVEPYSSTSNSLWPHAVQPLEYDAMFSYRWNDYDSTFVERLFDCVSSSEVKGKPIVVFLDRKRLCDGDASGRFCCSLCCSWARCAFGPRSRPMRSRQCASQPRQRCSHAQWNA